MQLSDFYPHNPSYREEIQNQIQSGIRRRLEQEPSTYFEDYPELLRNTFNAESFYLTPRGPGHLLSAVRHRALLHRNAPIPAAV